MITRIVAALLVTALAAPAGAQTLQPPTGEPPSIAVSITPLSPQELTEPNRAFECAVRGADGQNYRFALQYSGKRGYINPTTGEVEWIDGRAVVTQDESGLFSSYTRWTNAGNWFEATSEQEDAPFGPRVRLQIDRTDSPGVSSADVAILVQVYEGWLRLTKAVGFCRVEATEQQPLNEAEVLEHLRQR